jgi:hypothetical protein
MRSTGSRNWKLWTRRGEPIFCNGESTRRIASADQLEATGGGCGIALLIEKVQGLDHQPGDCRVAPGGQGVEPCLPGLGHFDGQCLCHASHRKSRLADLRGRFVW